MPVMVCIRWYFVTCMRYSVICQSSPPAIITLIVRPLQIMSLSLVPCICDMFGRVLRYFERVYVAIYSGCGILKHPF